MVIVHRKTAAISETSLARFVTRARRAANLKGRVNVLITGSREMQKLNARFRGKDKPTDVLSFPVAISDISGFSGDIAISVEIASKNSKLLGHPVSDELKILVLHGLLHLAGYDHETDTGQMARKESALRKLLKLPDGLIGRAELELRDRAHSKSLPPKREQNPRPVARRGKP